MATSPLSAETGNLSTFSRLPRFRSHAAGGATSMLVGVEHYDLTKAEPEDIVEGCSDQLSMRTAMALRLRIPDKIAGLTNESAIYAITVGHDDAVKIGVSFNPAERFKHLQLANPKQLQVHALFWIVEGEPITFERMIHRVAAKSGYEVRSEWVMGPVDDIVELAATVLHSANAKVADSAMWIRQRDAIVKAGYNDDAEPVLPDDWEPTWKL